MSGDGAGVIRFGDGSSAWFFGIVKDHYKDEKGVPKIKLRIKPTSEFRIKHNIPKELMDMKGTIVKEYKKEWFARNGYDNKYREIVTVLCDFNGKASSMTELFKEKDIRIEHLQYELQMKILEIIKLKQEREYALENDLKSIKKEGQYYAETRKITGSHTSIEQAPTQRAEMEEL